MSRIKILEQAVADLYAAHDPDRADWADWFGENHVFLVADNAVKLARKLRANEDLARAAALLHDVADTKMSRFVPEHEEASLAMARDLMRQAGFRDDEIHLVVDDAIRLHSCFDGHVPESIEGKILSTADSQAHLLTDFYIFAIWALGKRGKTLAEVKEFVLKKIDRDFYDKIQFDDVRSACQPAYESLKLLFTQ